MTNRSSFALAGLLLALLVAVLVFVPGAQVWKWASLALLAVGVTITYAWPPHTGTFPATLAQMYGHNLVTCQVALADTDTTATVVHNMNLTLAEGSLLFPLVVWSLSTPGTVWPIVSIAKPAASGNSIVILKNALTGNGCTLNVQIEKPHTIVR